jgi:anti-sigma-K factor RskA
MSPDEPQDTPRGAPDDMSLTLSEDMMAAEYVLGTLDPEERDDARARIASDFSFAALAQYWERRLGELHALTGDVEPPAAVWDAIKSKLGTVAPSAELRLPEVGPPAQPPAAGNVDALRARLLRWRNLSALTGSIAATLLLFVATSLVAPGLLPSRLRPRPETATPVAGTEAAPPARFVAVLQRDATAPAFILTVDIANHSLSLRRVSAPREPGKSYELWLISSKFPAPRSLGLVSTGDFTQSNDLVLDDPASIGDATFAVSLEPEGGSPTGAPSNVMFLGKPVESTPPGQPEH